MENVVGNTGWGDVTRKYIQVEYNDSRALKLKDVKRVGQTGRKANYFKNAITTTRVRTCMTLDEGAGCVYEAFRGVYDEALTCR